MICAKHIGSLDLVRAPSFSEITVSDGGASRVGGVGQTTEDFLGGFDGCQALRRPSSLAAFIVVHVRVKDATVIQSQMSSGLVGASLYGDHLETGTQNVAITDDRGYRFASLLRAQAQTERIFVWWSFRPERVCGRVASPFTLKMAAVSESVTVASARSTPRRTSRRQRDRRQMSSCRPSQLDGASKLTGITANDGLTRPRQCVTMTHHPVWPADAGSRIAGQPASAASRPPSSDHHHLFTPVRGIRCRRSRALAPTTARAVAATSRRLAECRGQDKVPPYVNCSRQMLGGSI